MNKPNKQIKKYEIVILNKGNKPDWLLADSPQIKQYDIILGWDTEYRNKEWELDLEKLTTIIEPLKNNYSYNVKQITQTINELDKKRTKECLKNDVISHQIVAYSREKDTYIELIIYLYDEHNKYFYNRITLGRLLAIVLEELGYKWSEIEELNKNLKIGLISHFSVAEFTALNPVDRKPLIKHLRKIQKTLASFSFFEWEIPMYESYKTKRNDIKQLQEVSIQWIDTMLIAPAGFKSLAKLATETTHKEKIKLTERDYINMVELLLCNKPLYEKYAIRDSIIAIEYFTIFMERFYKFTNGLVKRVPITEASSTQMHFLARLQEESKELTGFKTKLYKKIFGLEKSKTVLTSRHNDIGMVNESFLGGKNGIRIYEENYDCRKHKKIQIDIDFVNAYTAASATIPLVNWNNKLKKVITAKEHIQTVAKVCNEPSDTFTKIGFFQTHFKFPKEVKECVLPQRTKWGLKYTREGLTRTTFPEIIEAERLGGLEEGNIEELILYEEEKINNEIYFPFVKYMKLLTEMRNKATNPHDKRFLKGQQVCLYGGMGQGIDRIEFFNLQGKKERMKASLITNCEIASHVTGVIRACMCAMINEIEAFPGCEVINWTTDGMMILMDIDKEHWKNLKGGKYWSEEEQYPIFDTWKEDEGYDEDCWGKRILSKDNEEDIEIIGSIKNDGNDGLHLKDINPQLYQKLQQLRAVKVLKAGGNRIGLKGEDAWIKIKGFGDRFGSTATRANWMTYKNSTSAIARGNIGSHLIKNAEDFLKYTGQDDTDEINQIMIDSLMPINELIEKDCDLVVKRKIEGKGKARTYKQTFRNVNIGPDGNLQEDKRTLENFDNIDEYVKYRRTIDYMAENKIRKNPNNILWYTKKVKMSKIRGAKEETIYRTLISLMLRENIWRRTYKELAKKIIEFKLFKDKETIEKNKDKEKRIIQNIKNWKFRETIVKSIPKTGFYETKKKFEDMMKVNLDKIKFERYVF